MLALNLAGGRKERTRRLHGQQARQVAQNLHCHAGVEFCPERGRRQHHFGAPERNVRPAGGVQ